MKIESLIRRKDGTKVLMDDTQYHFKPAKEGGPHVATVTDKAHIARFLKITEGYCVADGDPALKAKPGEGPGIKPKANEKDQGAGDEGEEESNDETDTGASDNEPPPNKPTPKTGTPRKKRSQRAAEGNE